MLHVARSDFVGQERFSSRGRAEARAPAHKLPYESVAYFVACVDVVLIVLASLASDLLYQSSLGGDAADPSTYLGIGIIAALLYVLQLQAGGLYNARAIFGRKDDSAKVTLKWLLVGCVLLLTAFLLKTSASFSRGSVLTFILAGLVLLLTWRAAGRALIRTALAEGRIEGRKVVVIGDRADIAAVDEDDLLHRFGLSQVGRVVLPSGGNNGSHLTVSAVDLEALHDAAKLAREADADEILLAVSWDKTRRLELIRERLRISPLPVKLLPDQKIRAVAHNLAYQISGELVVNVQRAPLSRGEQFCKRALDIVVAATMLAMLAPLMAMAAIAIKLDSRGPVIFKQRRRGFNGAHFHIYKFRSMTVQEDGDRVIQAARNDSRVTRVGAWLRKSSVDELPQLFNVLKGDMSLIGPRPHALAHDAEFEKIVSDYAFRHHVKPGITGWAQCNGSRGATPHIAQVAERVRLDLWYINHWSLLLDIKILVSTFFEVVQARNSY